jgi:GTP-binding protein HflX
MTTALRHPRPDDDDEPRPDLHALPEDAAAWDTEQWDGQQWDREDRRALGRVANSAAGEIADVSEVEYRQLRLERVVLVGVWTSGGADAAQGSMDELAALADTAGSVVLDTLVQRRERPDPATYIGSGRVADLREMVAATGADTVICDGELTAAQLRTLEDRVGVKVVDRTALILDIFAQHASSAEGRAQVELAQLQYLLQRLRGWGGSLSRTGGGIGTRGPGETKLETDRRRVTTRISRLRRELAAMGDRREVTRHRRSRNEVPAVAIVGYTNAGKSSLLNRLTGAGVLVEDALFATLDPTVRRFRTPAGRTVTMADTVGFVRHLPTQLVESFRSTLEEVALADLVLHVVDSSAADPRAQLSAVRQELAEVRGADASPLPELVVLTKSDAADPLTLSELRHAEPGAVVVSARTGQGIEQLLDAVDEQLPGLPVTADVLLPWDRGDLLERVRHDGELLDLEYTGTGSRVRARVGAELAAALRPFTVPGGLATSTG